MFFFEIIVARSARKNETFTIVFIQCASCRYGYRRTDRHKMAAAAEHVVSNLKDLICGMQLGG